MANVVITGASSGIGLATALELGRAGHRVFATMRNPARLRELADSISRETPAITILTMDVDSDQSVSECFQQVFEQAPSIDVLVNNAGVERHGTVETLPMDAFRATMETNYFGALRCIRIVLPGMREQRSGCVINVTSVAGRISSSPLAAYAASKFALEALSEALAQEVKPSGIRVAIVQPGIIDTPMARALEHSAAEATSAQGRRFAHLFHASLQQPAPPSIVAETIRGIIESGTTQLRHPTGPDAVPFLAWRAAMTDEDWVEWGALEDDAWYDRVERDFGLNARP